MPETGTLVMLTLPFLLRNVRQFVCRLLTFLADGLRYPKLCLRPSSAPASENLFLRKQLALRVSSWTVRKYLARASESRLEQRAPCQRRLIFVRDDTNVIMAYDLCTAVTATFRMLFVSAVMEHATRRIPFQDMLGLACLVSQR
jgi:hypothetical protein